MLEDLALSLLHVAVYLTLGSIPVWIIFNVPFVHKSARRFKRFVDRVNDKLDEACGYY